MSSCPRCPHLVLTPGHGVIDEDVCGGCGGRFLSGQVSDRFVVFELGIERDVLREIASLFSGPRLPCPGCQGLMRSLRLRGVPVDLCLSCGGLWLDAGELVALSGGRHLEIGAPLLAAAAEPAVLGQMPPLVKKLGRGQSVVLLHQLEAACDFREQRKELLKVCAHMACYVWLCLASPRCPPPVCRLTSDV